ncbi:MAG: hypothetical protein ACOY0S_02385 [Patescibacteria group bacterium]
MNEQKKTQEFKNGGRPKHPGPINQGELYSKIASRWDEILNVLFRHLHSRNEAISVGAAKVLINKILPDLKSTELVGKDGQPLTITVKLDVAGGYIPQMGGIITAPTGSNTGSASVQSPSLAQESSKDDNSHSGTGQTGVT